MMRKLLTVGFLLCLLALSSQAADDKKTDKDKLQGSWVTSSITVDGKSKAIPKDEATVFIFKGDKFTVKMPEKKDVEGTFTIDEKKMAIDLTGPSDKDPKVLETKKALYALDGDTFKLVVSTKDDNDRPKGMDEKECAIITFKRMTK